jgi:hypothetical protein
MDTAAATTSKPTRWEARRFDRVILWDAEV